MSAGRRLFVARYEHRPAPGDPTTPLVDWRARPTGTPPAGVAAAYSRSGTKRATVRLEEAAGQLVIHVIDDGGGFDVREIAGSEAGRGGFGLFSVRERLGLIGGRLTVRSQPGQGTHIEVHAPPTQDRRPLADGAGP